MPLLKPSGPLNRREEDHDFVRIYAGATFDELVYSHSGKATSHWPGTAGTPPVVIAGDTFGVAFASDVTDTSWGWQITARARVPDEFLERLRGELSDESSPLVQEIDSVKPPG